MIAPVLEFRLDDTLVDGKPVACHACGSTFKCTFVKGWGMCAFCYGGNVYTAELMTGEPGPFPWGFYDEEATDV